jgi:hypothetical protein
VQIALTRARPACRCRQKYSSQADRSACARCLQAVPLTARRRVQDLLDDCAREIEGGSMASVPVVVRAVLRKPNEARANMYSAIEYLGTAKAQPARELVGARPPLLASALPRACVPRSAPGWYLQRLLDSGRNGSREQLLV